MHKPMRPDRVHFVVIVVHFLNGRPTGCGRRLRRWCRRRGRRRVRLGRGPGQKVGPAIRNEVGGRYAVDVR